MLDNLVDRFVPMAPLGGGKSSAEKCKEGIGGCIHSLQMARLQIHSLLTTTLQICKPTPVADVEERTKVHIGGSTTLPIG